jgi:hypothetical protein
VEGLVVFAIFGLFALVAGAFGADTRDGDDWSTHPRV